MPGLGLGLGLSKTRNPHAAPGGGGSYHADAVHFDGSTYFANSSLSFANSSLLTFSVWGRIPVVPPATSTPVVFFDFDPLNIEMVFQMSRIDASNSHFEFYVADGAGKSLTGNAGDNTADADVWYNYFGYADTNHPAGEKIIGLYQSDNLGGAPIDLLALFGANINDSSAAFTMPFSGRPFNVPDGPDDFSLPWPVVEMADFWIGPGVLETDLSVFRDPVTGKPKDPSGFPAGGILLTGDATAWGAQAIAQGFTLTGSLTNASTSPSD